MKSHNCAVRIMARLHAGILVNNQLDALFQCNYLFHLTSPGCSKHVREAQYCLLSEEQNSVSKNPQKIWYSAPLEALCPLSHAEALSMLVSPASLHCDADEDEGTIIL